MHITAEQAFKVGRFLGYYYSPRGGRAKIVIGKDTRLSSYTLEYAIAAGVTSSGGDAYIMHVTTTPSVSFIARTCGFDCGVMISASHNPYGDNGIKIVNSRGEKVERGVLNLIEDYIDGILGKDEASAIPFAEGESVGRTVDFAAGRSRYAAYLISLAAFSCRGLKIGLDCANGASYKIAASVFDALGADVYLTGAEPDGLNINEGCGSTCPQSIIKLVKDNGLDVGFAFDGDGDRCICCDGRGQIVDGDGILYVAAKRLKAKGELFGNSIVATVMSNGGLKNSLKKEGISVTECPVGDSCVYSAMCAGGAALGGEQSGHIIFGKVECTGDGIVTALNVAEAMCASGLPLAELVRGFEKNAQYVLNIAVRDKAAAVSDAGVLRVVESARTALSDRGKIIFRASGTENMVRVMCESDSLCECESVCKAIADAVKKSEGE